MLDINSYADEFKKLDAIMDEHRDVIDRLIENPFTDRDIQILTQMCQELGINHETLPRRTGVNHQHNRRQSQHGRRLHR